MCLVVQHVSCCGVIGTQTAHLTADTYWDPSPQVTSTPSWWGSGVSTGKCCWGLVAFWDDKTIYKPSWLSGDMSGVTNASEAFSLSRRWQRLWHPQDPDRTGCWGTSLLFIPAMPGSLLSVVLDPPTLESQRIQPSCLPLTGSLVWAGVERNPNSPQRSDPPLLTVGPWGVAPWCIGRGHAGWVTGCSACTPGGRSMRWVRIMTVLRSVCDDWRWIWVLDLWSPDTDSAIKANDCLLMAVLGQDCWPLLLHVAHKFNVVWCTMEDNKTHGAADFKTFLWEFSFSFSSEEC